MNPTLLDRILDIEKRLARQEATIFDMEIQLEKYRNPPVQKGDICKHRRTVVRY